MHSRLDPPRSKVIRIYRYKSSRNLLKNIYKIVNRIQKPDKIRMMGCYLGKPDDNVYVTEGKGNNFTYATASCQGWRREQEDAEVCIPHFDQNASLFVLCDGHGGAEVAQYTVKYLPDFLKSHPLYKEGKYEEALSKAFVEFDALLRTDKVMEELRKLAYDGKKKAKQPRETKSEDSTSEIGGSSIDENEASASSINQATTSSGSGPSSSNGPSTVVEDVDVETLRREAQVPIEELIDKYVDQEAKGRILSLRQTVIGQSPVIKNKDHEEDKIGSNDPEATSSTGKTNDKYENWYNKLKDAPPESKLNIMLECLNAEHDSDSESDDEDIEGLQDTDDWSDEDDDEEDDDDDDDEEEEEEEEEEEDEESDEEVDEEVDEVRNDDDDGDDECEEESPEERKKSKKLRTKNMQRQPDDKSSGYDDDDERGSESESESESNKDELADIISEQRALNERKCLTKKLEERISSSKIHRPVMDSGCTVVVALVKDNKLYVASAGDSRCIVIMRDGQCKPMSFDHKPEDDKEFQRILAAGGFVMEGRVNGGLNLSRAFGDFTYKDASLEASKQMITPCPDVRTFDLGQNQVEYIFLACDGIWNSMKNQHVTKFICKVAPTVDYDLVKTCMAVFKNCLAQETDGDGTGCDNMTCIIARYDDCKEEESSTTNQCDLKTSTTNDEKTSDDINIATSQETKKRVAIDDSGDNHKNKRRCLRLLSD